MIFRRLDQNNDWTFGAGSGNYASRDEAIGLNVKTKLLSWLNDCFFDLAEGIDWYNRLGSKNQRELLEADLRRKITQCDGVTGILSFDITSFAEREFNAKYEITTRYSRLFRDSIVTGV